MTELWVFLLIGACLYLLIRLGKLEKRLSEHSAVLDRTVSRLEERLRNVSDRMDSLHRAFTSGKTAPDDMKPDEEIPVEVCGHEVEREGVQTMSTSPYTGTEHSAVFDPVPAMDDIPDESLHGDGTDVEPPPLPDFEPPAMESAEDLPPDTIAVLDEDTEPVYVMKEAPEEPSHTASGSQPEKEDSLFEKWEEFKKNVDWELFTGTKLFAWLGVFALFVGSLFFVKLSMDRGWFPPALRLAIGAVTGVGLCLVSVKKMSDRLLVLRHTFAAAGVGTLYGVVFASTLFYDYLPKPAGFALLSLITATAFVLSVYHSGVSISVLGAVGAFLTPVLVNTGGGNLSMLFLYLAVVNIGLYLVMSRLSSPFLLLLGAGGTVITMGLGTTDVFTTSSSLEIGGVWTGNLMLFSVFLYLKRELDLRKNKNLFRSGVITYLAALGTAIVLTAFKPGWIPLFMITAAVTGGIVLAWFQEGWYRSFVPYAALSFVAALGWTFFRFDATGFSASYILIFLYGVAGCMGPLALVRKYGLTPSMALWFKRFPIAISLMCLVGLFNNPGCSFLFWPLILGIQVIGIGLSFLFRAFFQIVLLIVMFVAGGLFWMFHIPADGIGFGFFAYILFAGLVLTVLLTLIVGKLPEILRALNMAESGLVSESADEGAGLISGYGPWLTAAPSTGVFVLLGAAFMVPYPHFPHPGMATLVCFLVLALFFSRRIQFEPSNVMSLVAAALSQAVWVFMPYTGLVLKGIEFLYPAVCWSFCLFAVSMVSPFLLFKDHRVWKKTWNAFAVFEIAQFLFFIISARHYYHGTWVSWLPAVPFLMKLPFVAMLLKQLSGKEQRNSILAFHGGVLLFYLTTLPVLLLDHGWIGLALVVEATALLWLNTRIDHPGLRKVAALMAPCGLVIVYVALPVLKTPESMKLANAAVFAVAASVIALSGGVKFAGYPERKLWKLDLPDYFLWLALSTGFCLVNLMISDLFAGQGERFNIFPDGQFLQSAAYAVSWVLFGGMVWKIRSFPKALRNAGFIILSIGAVFMIILPVLWPESIVSMPPFFNPALYTYMTMLAVLYFVFYTESYDDEKGVSKNIFLAYFLVTVFVAVKIVKSTVLQNGDPFTLFSEHTLTHAVSSAAAMLIYGTVLLIWPKRLDRPFRLAGFVLLWVAMGKSFYLPMAFTDDFGALNPMLNLPTVLFGFILMVLVFFSARAWKEPWPVHQIQPRPLWPVTFAVAAFYVMNVEIASCLETGHYGFTFSTIGNWGKQFGYSIGWLIYAICLLIAGIWVESKKTRWAAIILLSVTSLKIFFDDLWSLGQMYRVGSFFGLAVVLILVSYLYQRFIAEPKDRSSDSIEETEDIR